MRNTNSLINRLAALLSVCFALGVFDAQAATATRSSSFVYDTTTGLLTKEIVEPNDSQLCLVTEYTYDVYGNKTTAITRNCNGSAGEAAAPVVGSDGVIAPRTTSSTYDTQGQFVVNATNTLGHTENRTYDPRFGIVTSLTGPNGLTTTWVYDDAGRKRTETRADGTQTTWAYVAYNCPGCYGMTEIKYYVYTATSGITTPSWAYYDSLNRKVLSIQGNMDGTSYVSENTQYDANGRVFKASLPYSGTTTINNPYVRYTVFNYDILGRVITETAPDNSVTSKTYNGLTTVVTNALNQTKTIVKNTQGQTVSVIDTQNKAVNYIYDPFDNLIQTIDALGNVTTLTYDARGRKTGMVDPDMGSWTYAYNALGALIRQVDAKAQTVTMAYDLLGRMTNRSEPDLVSTWVYDTASHGIGKIASASSDNGYSRTHSYDALGRPIGTSTIIDSPTPYVTGTSYDAYGRVDTQTYPTGFAVKNVYSANGYISQVVNAAAPATVYWTANGMDAAGHLVQQTYGNGITTNQIYDLATGRMIQQLAGTGNAVQNITYQYDSLGSLTTKNDSFGLLETYLYDNLNRLTTATALSSLVNTSTTFAYDDIGNLICKSNLSACSAATPNYVYNASGPASVHPHAVSQFLGNLQGNIVNPTFTYDANGNMLSGAARTITWTSFNMPAQITFGAKFDQFQYNPEHERIKETEVDGTFIVSLSPRYDTGIHFEKITKPDGTVEYENFLYAGNVMFGQIEQYATVAAPSTITSTLVRYFHKDNQGSITAITNELGTVVQRLSYEPFGNRRYATGVAAPDGFFLTGVARNTEHGYTGHEHLDEVGVIHMNGRLYDPVLSRFISADPHIQDPFNLQSYNRYSYCWGNPMVCTDPSGYFSFGGFFRAVVSIAVAVYAPQVIAHTALATSVATATGISAIAVGSVTAGAIVGAINSGNMQGAFTGAVTAGMFGGLHDWAPSGFLDSAMKVAAHGSVGGIASVLQGGDFKSGFMSASFTQAASLSGAFNGIQSRVGNAVAAAMVGGTASVLGGGKFENGAVTGAFSRLFNDLKFEGVAKTDQKGRIYVEGTATLTDQKTGEVLMSGPAISGPYGEGALPGGDYVGNNFRTRAETAMTVNDSQGKVGWSVDLSDKGGRTELRIHPDGNVWGTQGCIAPQTQARDWGNNLREQINKYGSIPVKVSY